MSGTVSFWEPQDGHDSQWAAPIAAVGKTSCVIETVR